jgi:hypothetical protein
MGTRQEQMEPFTLSQGLLREGWEEAVAETLAARHRADKGPATQGRVAQPDFGLSRTSAYPSKPPSRVASRRTDTSRIRPLPHRRVPASIRLVHRPSLGSFASGVSASVTPSGAPAILSGYPHSRESSEERSS